MRRPPTGAPAPSLAEVASRDEPRRGSGGATLAGATRAEQLDDVLAAADVTLEPEALTAVNRISKEIPYPLG